MKNLGLFIITVLLLVSCKKVEEPKDEDYGFCELIPIDNFPCGPEVISDALRYDSVPNTYFNLTDIKVYDNYMRIELSASGCDGSTWQVNLVDAQTIAYTNPMTKDLKIEFINNEDCLAVFSKLYYFDIAPLQETSDTIINLHIENADTSVLYSY